MPSPSLLTKECLSCGAPLSGGSLVCAFCGSAHLVQGNALQSACPGCGAGNPPHAKSCVQCKAKLLLPCPECTAQNPLGSRFCHDCQIEFRSYQTAAVYRAPNQVAYEDIEQKVQAWLESRWFKARDINRRLSFLEKNLLWLPVWRFASRVEGEVQGQVSQTMYRTVSNRTRDRETNKWVTNTNSVPYKVWNHVRKDFDKQVQVTERAGPRAAKEHYLFLESQRLNVPKEPLSENITQESWELTFHPEGEDTEVYARLRAKAERKLRGSLLERVESLKVKFRGPVHSLMFHPVWYVIYRYKRSHGSVRIHGTTGAIDGKKISLLTQWFG